MSSPALAPWEQPGYSEIVEIEQVGGDVQVQFANGDVVRVAPSRFGVDDPVTVRFDVDQPSGLTLAGESSSRELSWVQIRTATDPDFAQEMRRQDAEESRRIGRRLRALREDRGLSQRELAQLVGMAPPQLSKIEGGYSDLRVSTVQTLLRAVGASFADIAGPDALEFSQKSLRSRAQKVGIPGELIDRLFASSPRRLISQLLSRAFGWNRDSLEFEPSPGPEQLGISLAFKATKSLDAASSSPLVQFAVECSKVVVSNTTQSEFRMLPESSKVRSAAIDTNGLITIASLTEWAWEQGVRVLPLQGKGSFCAAAWSIDGQPIVTVKDSRASAVFWVFDLAHELGHIALGHVLNEAIIDVDALGPDASINDVQERDANNYALEVLLGDHKLLIDQVRHEARGNYLRFKGAVATVAKQAEVSAGILGMVAAYELTDIGQAKDRWGSATNLAIPDGQGRSVVEGALLDRLQIAELDDVDKSLLSLAVPLKE
jgi:transcriptional regulator with XRE-family HTH domain/Zn-dependent peptidase ImmA (M78 family)